MLEPHQSNQAQTVRPIFVLITDLDNTIYDWVTYFSQSFYDMVDEAVKILDVPKDQLLDEFREVHQRYHNSEHPFALLETRSVMTKYGSLSRAERAKTLDPAFHRFNKTRLATLKLYPGVWETLHDLKQRGVPIIGHTEATVPNALFRLRTLKIEACFDRLYAVRPDGDGHPDPAWAKLFDDTPIKVVYLDHDERKPNPRVLLDICCDLEISPKNTVYVGDSLSRDVGMAREAGVWTAWAKYGTIYDATLWDRLVRITHWTAEDVRRVEMAKRRFANVHADWTLKESFSELLDYYSFGEDRRAGMS
jgi:phosphoglycolate phosphatase